MRISNVALLPSQFLDASATPAGASLTVGSLSQSSISIGPAGTLNLPHNTTPSVNSTNALNIASGGGLDLSNNTLLINYGSAPDPASVLRSYLAAAYDNGAWDGWGITSSAVTANPASYAIGYADSADGTSLGLKPNTIELKYTVIGDTNLDGTVNLADLLALTRHFGQAAGWDAGDVNYDGTVGLSDFLALSRHFGQSLPTMAAVLPSGTGDDPLKPLLAGTAARRRA
ncbi:MAG TPA: dockerin type I repeat-containing protein [Tepidisphaeraceae bacterium]|nr:dockerin type I repeat-containing protein [Tepidisphaeraceae bacterium]